MQCPHAQTSRGPLWRPRDAPSPIPPLPSLACPSGQVQSVSCGMAWVLSSAQACMCLAIPAPSPPFTEALGAGPVLPQPSAYLPPPWVSFSEGPAALQVCSAGPVSPQGEYSAFVYSYAVEKPLSVGHKVAGYLPSLFWGFITLGRLISIPISSKLKPVTMVFINVVSGLLSLPGSTGGLFTPGPPAAPGHLLRTGLCQQSRNVVDGGKQK